MLGIEELGISDVFYEKLFSKVATPFPIVLAVSESSRSFTFVAILNLFNFSITSKEKSL